MSNHSLILEYIKVSNSKAEAECFSDARELANEARALLAQATDLTQAERDELTLKLDRHFDYIEELESNKGDWLAQWYAGTASGQALRDVKKGRTKVIKLN